MQDQDLLIYYLNFSVCAVTPNTNLLSQILFSPISGLTNSLWECWSLRGWHIHGKRKILIIAGYESLHLGVLFLNFKSARLVLLVNQKAFKNYKVQKCSCQEHFYQIAVVYLVNQSKMSSFSSYLCWLILFCNIHRTVLHFSTHPFLSCHSRLKLSPSLGTALSLSAAVTMNHWPFSSSQLHSSCFLNPAVKYFTKQGVFFPHHHIC